MRLFVLRPGHSNAPISGTFIIRKLSSHTTPYEALSYVWGQFHDRKTVTIDGCIVSITNNLFEGLQHLRYPDRERVLWIDALCINQEDNEEKAVQVALMNAFYASASNVIIWLGTATEVTPMGMEVFKYLAGHDELMGPTAPWNQYSQDLLYAGLNDIVSLEYWQRVWVVQEFVLARSIILQRGPYSISWTGERDISRLLIRIKFAEISPEWKKARLNRCNMDAFLEVLEQQQATQRRTPYEPSLLDLVHKFRHRKATDSRDGLYGLLALAPAGTRYGLSVSYDSSVDEVFRNFLSVIEKENPEIMGGRVQNVR